MSKENPNPVENQIQVNPQELHQNGNGKAAAITATSNVNGQPSTDVPDTTQKTKRAASSGHIINVGNMQKMIAYCKAVGADYAPKNDAITIVNLEAGFNTYMESLGNTNAQLAAFNNAIGERKLLFDELKKTNTKIMGALQAPGAKDHTMAHATSLTRKLRGQRVGTEPTLTSAALAAGNISVSTAKAQTGFDSRLNNFGLFIEFLKLQPGYLPKEADLTIEGLTAFHKKLADATQVAKDMEGNITAVRNQRNDLQYQADNNLFCVQKW